MSGARVQTLVEVSVERQRQDALFVTGKHAFNTSNPSVPGEAKLGILAEEFGEVAKALNDGTDELRVELIHVAAVAVAWAESLLPVGDEAGVAA